jgi:LPS export ABC transporter protein LptC
MNQSAATSLRRVKVLLALVTLVGFLGVVIAFGVRIFSVKDAPPVPARTENTPDANHVFREIHYTSTNEQGVTEWELNALKADFFQDQSVAGFKDVEVKFFSKEGRIFTVRGDTGTLNTQTRDFQLSGNVVGTSNDGYKFLTETLSYEAVKRQVKSDAKVLLESPQFILEGQGMVMDLDQQKVSLSKNVVARQKV